MSIFELFFLLLMGHALADFGLQGIDMIHLKNRNSDDLRKQFGGGIYSNLAPWYYWLIGHGLIHGFAVWFFTGNLLLALLETVMHCLIDYGKCEKWYGIHLDQFMHIACKLMWAVWTF